jgi:hypothetical protein
VWNIRFRIISCYTTLFIFILDIINKFWCHLISGVGMVTGLSKLQTGLWQQKSLGSVSKWQLGGTAGYEGHLQHIWICLSVLFMFFSCCIVIKLHPSWRIFLCAIPFIYNKLCVFINLFIISALGSAYINDYEKYTKEAFNLLNYLSQINFD